MIYWVICQFKKTNRNNNREYTLIIEPVKNQAMIVKDGDDIKFKVINKLNTLDKGILKNILTHKTFKIALMSKLTIRLLLNLREEAIENLKKQYSI